MVCKTPGCEEEDVCKNPNKQEYGYCMYCAMNGEHLK